MKNILAKNTFFQFCQFSVSEEDHNPETRELEDSHHEGNLRGVETEPADGVVVEDVDDVGEQDQSHSSAETFPGRRIKYNIVYQS